MELYQRIKLRREELELSQEDLAKRLGYRSRSTIAKIESGTNDIPQSKISAFAKALDTSEAWLMGYEDSPDSYTEYVNSDSIAFEITPRSLKHSPAIYEAICEQLKCILPVTKNTIYTDGKRKYHSLYELLIDNNSSYEEKAILLNAVIHFAILDTKNNQLSLFINENINHRYDTLSSIINYCQRLTLDGLQKVEIYSKDIASMSSYVKSEQQYNYDLNAAHEDNPTMEQEITANNIMKDDKEWE